MPNRRLLSSLLAGLLAACGGAGTPAGAGAADAGAGGEGGGGGAGGSGGAEPPDCTLSLEGLTPEGAWIPLEGGESVALVNGFQGFVYSMVRIRSEGILVDVASVRITTHVEGFPDGPGHLGEDPFTPVEGGSISGDLMVFFNGSPWGELLDKEVRYTTVLTSDACDGLSRATALLVPGEERTPPP